ncbi:MAG TPA: SCO family protein [Nitrospirota bacterium]|nr:SCO family protein [Nitrospirota bacterium]
MLKICLALIMSLLFTTTVRGHGTVATSADISLDEKLGQVIPADAMFRDETGRTVNLKNLIDKPTIIAPVYLKCMHECPLLLSGLAQALGKIDLVRPGKDFRVIALSFDDTDTPAVAREKKKDYLKAVGRSFPAEAWTFLTGDAANIRTFTDSIGFTFQRDGKDFSHPLTVVVLAPGGTVSRYLYGMTFLPFNVTMAVTEAAEGKIGSTTGRVLNYCFSYDPLERSYVFNVLKVSGTVMVLTVVGVLIYLIVTTRKQRGMT